MSVSAIALAISINLKYNTYEYVTDSELHGKADYWQSPSEFENNKKGDCEDYAIAKYKALQMSGVPEDNLRLAYVVATKNNEAHMVLLYLHKGVWLVLDNMTDDIESLETRNDLIPIYSFNRTRLWKYNKSRMPKERIDSQHLGPVTRLDEILRR